MKDAIHDYMRFYHQEEIGYNLFSTNISMHALIHTHLFNCKLIIYFLPVFSKPGSLALTGALRYALRGKKV